MYLGMLRRLIMSLSFHDGEVSLSGIENEGLNRLFPLDRAPLLRSTRDRVTRVISI